MEVWWCCWCLFTDRGDSSDLLDGGNKAVISHLSHLGHLPAEFERPALTLLEQALISVLILINFILLYLKILKVSLQCFLQPKQFLLAS